MPFVGAYFCTDELGFIGWTRAKGTIIKWLKKLQKWIFFYKNEQKNE